MFFFSEASLAHETACALRDAGDLSSAAGHFEISARKRKVTKFTRTHAVTLGYLGTVQARMGEIERACSTWASALTAMSDVQSGRTRDVAREIRETVASYAGKQISGVDEVAAQASNHLAGIR
ncbi:hypothetical protein NLM24_30390 [Nocardia zapadnayensis]|nr:hypothetical protein [Nocardia zapadnayensis]MCX0274931.1 hypothetical protein [Nocardia zapadnayensis]